MNKDFDKLVKAQLVISCLVNALREIVNASNPLIHELFLYEIEPVVRLKQKIERIISLIE